MTTRGLRLIKTKYDVAIVGSGHNGLVAAAYLAAAGMSVIVLEKNETLGGATASARVFPDYDAWLSRYSYLVSLLPPKIVDDLKLRFDTRRRRIASFTHYFNDQASPRGLLISNVDEAASRTSVERLSGKTQDWQGYQRLLALESSIAGIAWPSLLNPLRSRSQFRQSLTGADQREAWDAFVERPLGETIERHVKHDVLRGLLLTDAKIGVSTQPHDESLLQNRCFLYHVIGQGTGEWRVPIGGMRTLVDALVDRGRSLTVQYMTHAPVQRVVIGNDQHTVSFLHDDKPHTIDATYVLINAGPRTYARLLDTPYSADEADEGSVVKVNMLLRRLPRLKTTDASSVDAFTGSFHVDEGYEAMNKSYQQSREGKLPDRPPFEIYCHTLTDPSILAPELAAQGFHTLTLFGLDVPYRLFTVDHDARRDELLRRYIAAMDEICDESFADCLATARDGTPCIEIKTPQDLERDVDLDQGNIFHNSPSWFFTDDESKVDQWGVETSFDRVFIAGSSAARGGAVSGIPGHNAAMAILARSP